MAIPKYNEMMPAVIEFLGDGEIHTALETAQFVAKTFGLTEAELQERLPSGVPCVSNRVGWALAYLKKAGLIERPKRACYRLTRTGQEAYRKGSACVTLEYLRQFPSFTAYVSHQNRSDAGTPSAPEEPASQTQSPQEMMDAALAELNASLADDLMTELMKISDTDFERLVAHLLIKMGYGSLRLNEDAVTKKSGDEGIDGIITADKFGFDAIYIQAKRWKPESTVGRPDIQKFLGALVGQGATKGLFITTGRFSEGAIRYAEKQLHAKIVLVDGTQLTKLMIEYDFGVSSAATYTIKRVDYDFFQEEI